MEVCPGEEQAGDKAGKLTRHQKRHCMHKGEPLAVAPLAHGDDMRWDPACQYESDDVRVIPCLYVCLPVRSRTARQRPRPRAGLPTSTITPLVQRFTVISVNERQSSCASLLFQLMNDNGIDFNP